MPQIRVSFSGREKPWKKTVDTKAKTVEDALIDIGINPLEVLIKLNGEFVPDIERIMAGDKLELLEIAARG